MTEELAGKLKEAGFPQNHQFHKKGNSEFKYCSKCGWHTDEPLFHACQPYLSELIEECRKLIPNTSFTLTVPCLTNTQFPDAKPKWIAQLLPSLHAGIAMNAHDAVAHLYLQVKKNES